MDTVTVTTIRITVAGRTITAQLAGNPTGQDLAAQLPLTLTIRDFNRVEKIADLPRPLTMEGVPPATTPKSTTSATTHPPTTSSSTTARSATTTASSASARFSGQGIQLIEQQQDSTQITIERA